MGYTPTPPPPKAFSRGGSLLPSSYADVRAPLMTASHSEGRTSSGTNLLQMSMLVALPPLQCQCCC